MLISFRILGKQKSPIFKKQPEKLHNEIKTTRCTQLPLCAEGIMHTDAFAETQGSEFLPQVEAPRAESPAGPCVGECGYHGDDGS